MPVNDYSPDTGLDELGENGESVKGSTIIIITILLALICLPATLTLIQIIREPTQENGITVKDQIIPKQDLTVLEEIGDISDESE